jgi:hypothetical protein
VIEGGVPFTKEYMYNGWVGSTYADDGAYMPSSDQMIPSHTHAGTSNTAPTAICFGEEHHKWRRKPGQQTVATISGLPGLHLPGLRCFLPTDNKILKTVKIALPPGIVRRGSMRRPPARCPMLSDLKPLAPAIDPGASLPTTNPKLTRYTSRAAL